MGRSTDNGVTFFINRQMLDTEGKRSIHGNIVINGDSSVPAYVYLKKYGMLNVTKLKGAARKHKG